MLTQIRAAQSDLDQLLSQLGNAGSVPAEIINQRQLLAQLERNLASGISSASPASLRNEIAGAIAAATSLGQQARAAGDPRVGLELATAQARTRASVAEMSRDIYERRIFDPYLRFASEDDEAAYRRREEESRRAIERALAENTPEGDLRAARIMRDQLRDAAAHGADASPEFQRLNNRNAEDIDRLEVALGRGQSRGQQAQPSQTSEPPAPATDEQLASVLATFRAAGIDGGIPATDSQHGLTVDRNPPDQGRSA